MAINNWFLWFNEELVNAVFLVKLPIKTHHCGGTTEEKLPRGRRECDFKPRSITVLVSTVNASNATKPARKMGR